MNERLRVVIVMPVYRDWDCAAMLCRALDAQVATAPDIEACALLVDDGSPDGAERWTDVECAGLTSIRALRLRTNLGHQRAIACGLCYVQDHMPCDAVVVMDADGEDRPEDVVRLVRRVVSGSPRVLFAERGRRFERQTFQIGYVLFRWAHRILTGIRVRVGNFSVIPFNMLGRLVTMSELWNHYAGAVFKSKLPYETMRIDRGRRLMGHSQMNTVGLVTHGLAAIATFYDVVATRILIANVAAMVALVIVLGVVIGVRFGTDLAVPGWATYTAGMLVLLLVQVVAISFSLVFTLIAGRSQMTVVPSRDYAVFIDRIETL